MEELFKDLSLEQLAEISEKYPKYAEKVNEEIEKRNKAEQDLQEKLEKAMQAENAREALKTTFLDKALEIFPTKPEGINNIVIYWKDVKVNEGKKDEHFESQIDILDNIYWKASPISSSTNKENKGSRIVTVSKVVNGSIVETFWFDNAELASQYFGIAKDKGSAVKRLREYDSEGVQFLVSNGAKDGIARKEVSES